MGIIADNDAKLNAALGNGTLFDVFTDVYHPEVTMIEATGDSWTGLDANLEREKGFFGSITEFKGGSITDVVVDEAQGISYNRQWMHALLANGHEMNMTEISVRHWKDGKIIKEQFFYNA